MAPLHQLIAPMCQLWLTKQAQLADFISQRSRERSRGSCGGQFTYVLVSGESTHCFFFFCLFLSCILCKLTSENNHAILTFRIVKRSYSVVFVFPHMCICSEGETGISVKVICLHAACLYWGCGCDMWRWSVFCLIQLTLEIKMYIPMCIYIRCVNQSLWPPYN